MSKKNKIWIIVAISFILLAGLIFVGTMSFLNWDFMKLGTTQYENGTHTVSGDFLNITINIDTADILFLKSDNESCTVEYIEDAKVKHTITVKEETLKIDIDDNRKWYDHITFFGFVEPKIQVYLPKDKYESLVVNANTSDITVPRDFTFGNVEIETDTGDVKFLASALEKLDISTDTGEIEIGELGNDYKNINLKTSTGDIKLWHIVAREKITIQSSTGDVWLGAMDVPYVSVKTSTGDVEGNLYTAPKFITKTDTGDVKVPDARTDDVFEITTNTGDIYFKIVK